MSTIQLLESAAVIGLIPFSLAAIRGQLDRSVIFWLLWLVAMVCAGAVVWRLTAAGWQAGLVPNLWVVVAATLLIYALIVALDRSATALGTLLVPYLLVLACLAGLAGWVASPESSAAASIPWFTIHILLAVGSYALMTITAVAALAIVLQERAMKQRRQGWAMRHLPPIAATEQLQQRLLWLAAIAMGLALASGAANEFMDSGSLILIPHQMAHKILLSVLAFLVILVFLVLHQATGLRGRLAARWLMTGYLLLTLAYPGVKFVRDVLLG
ncbi:MAG TPA: cytochrome c biogenesis protein CcsA [Terriglobia bacterium]|nr:cytochrome c biogenesis protein CcsA [Terriglobia bacterium]